MRSFKIGPYARLLSAPGTVPFEVAGFAARMGHLMTVLSVVFFVSARTGSYGLAGTAGAAYALAYALASPLFSRLIDRHGQGRVLALLAMANAASRAGFLAAVWLGAPAWSLLAASTLSGATMPPAAALVRARWSRLLRGSALLETALSLESVVDQTILITTPVTVSVLATYLNPAAGTICAMVLAAAGTASLAGQWRANPLPGRPSGADSRSVLLLPGFPLLILTCTAIGAAQTIVSIATVAFTEDHGAKVLSGPILAALALCSAASGLWYGTRQWRATAERRLVTTLPLFALGTLVFVAAWSIWVLFLAAFVLGLAVAPTMIAAYSIISRIVPERQLTEGLTWVTSALGIGISAGSAVSGTMVDMWGTRAAYAAASCCAGVAIMAAASTAGRLRRTDTGEPAIAVGVIRSCGGVQRSGSQGHGPDPPAA
jgi:MFS family permease